MFLLSFSGCSFFTDFFSDGKKETSPKKNEEDVNISSLRFTNSSLSVKVGEMTYLSYIVSPSGTDITPEWTYDKNYINCQSQGNGVIITGVKEGQTPLTVSYKNKSATCIINIAGYSESYVPLVEPYIYSQYSVIQMSTGTTERIDVSLFNGDVSDLENYTWTIDNSSTASISPTGQYCVVTALQEGYAKITVRNTKAAYPYYIGIYVFNNPSKSTYITTSQNIVTIKKSDGEVTVKADVVNPVVNDYKSGFEYEIVKLDDGEVNKDKKDEIKDKKDEIISIVANGDSCIITPLKEGMCTLRITNSKAGAVYPLEMTVRVLNVVDNLYIEPSSSIIRLNGGKDSYTLSVELKSKGTSYGNLALNTDYDRSSFTFEIEDDEVVAGYSWENNIILSGLKNGMTSVYIGYPSCTTKRQVLVFVDGFMQDSVYVDASCYITTSQNYIRTKVGAEDTVLYVSLKGGDDSDATNYTWSVIQNPDDGVSDVISLETAFGTIKSSRSAAATIHNASAIVHPKAIGSAVITVSNSKCLYSTDILVKVLDEDAILVQPRYFTGSGIVEIIGEQKVEYSVNFINGSETDSYDITWESDNSALNINSNGTKAVMSSSSSNAFSSYVTISHPDVIQSKMVLVLYATTAEELANMRALYSDQTSYSVNVGSYIDIDVKARGFYDDEGETLSFSSVTEDVVWHSFDESVATVVIPDDNYPLRGRVTGVSRGTTKLSISYADITAEFSVKVYPEGVSIDGVEPLCYLTTSQNVVILNSLGQTKTVFVNSVGLSETEINNISWSCENPGVCSVVANGRAATLTALNGGETTITVSHPNSDNRLIIHVRVGSEYVAIDNQNEGSGNGSGNGGSNSFNDNEDVCYISTSQNYIKTKVGAQDSLLTVALRNGSYGAENNFVWSIEQNPLDGVSDVISFLTPTGSPAFTESVNSMVNFSSNSLSSPVSYGKAIIEPLAEGTATITVSNPEAAYDIQILVKVLDSNAELENSLYLSGNDIISFLNDERISYSVSLSGLDKVVGDENSITWSCDNSNIILYANGTTAFLSSKASDNTVAHLTISHPKAEFDKTVLVLAGNTEQELRTSRAFYLEKSAFNINVGKTVSLNTAVFGFDNIDFNSVAAKCVWESSNPSVAAVERNPENPLVGIASGIKAGSTKITLTYLNTSASCMLYVYPKEVDISSISDAEEDKKNEENGSSGGGEIGSESSSSSDTSGNGFEINVSSGEIDISAIKNNNIITFMASDGFDSYSWILDGLVKNSVKNELKLDTTEYMPGKYEISLLAVKNGALYSVAIQFEI